MYCELFGLRQPPFDDLPDPRFFFPSADHEEALALLRFAANHRKGLVLLTGGLGTGKTLLCRTLLARLENGGVGLLGTCTPGDPNGLISRTCKALNLRLAPNVAPAEAAENLKKHILSSTSTRRPVVVLVLDQAENLAPGDFEQLNTLQSLEDRGRRLMQVILVGQSQMLATLQAPEFEPLRQRMYACHELKTLKAEEIEPYINHRLAAAGYDGQAIFDSEAVARIGDRSRGIPRVINQLCDAAMLSAYSSGRETVDGQLIGEIRLPSDLVAQDAPATTARPAPAAPEPQSDPALAGRVEQVLTEGERLAERLEQALQHAETLRTSPGPVRTAGESMTRPGAAELAAGQLAELVDATPQVLAAANASLDDVERRIEVACARAEQAAARLEGAISRSEDVDQRTRTRVEAISQACERAEAGERHLKQAGEELSQASNQRAQMLADLLERLEASGGVDGLIQRLDRIGQFTREKAEAAIAALAEQTEQAITQQVQAIDAKLTEARQASEGLFGRITEGHRETESLEKRIEQRVTEGRAASRELDQAVDWATRSCESLRQDADNATELVRSIETLTETLVETNERANETIDTAHTATEQLKDQIQAGTETSRDVESLCTTATTKAVQLGELTRISEDACGRASSVLSEVRSTTDHLENQAGQLRGTIANLNEIAGKATETSTVLRTESAAASEQAARLASTTSAARAAQQQTNSSVQDAHDALERLDRSKGDITATGEQIRTMIVDAERSATDRFVALNEHADATIARSETTARQAGERMQSLLDDADEVVQAKLAAAREQADALGEQIEQQAGALGEQIKQQITEVEASVQTATQTAVAEATTAADRLSDRLSSMIEDSGTMIDARIEGLHQELESKLGTARKQVETLEDQLQETLDTAAESCRNAQASYEATREQTTREAENVESLRGDLEVLTEQIDEKLTTSAKASEQIEKLIENVWSLTTTAEDRRRDLTTEGDRVTGLLEALRESTGQTDSLMGRLAAQTEQVRKLMGAVERRSNAVPDLVRQLAELNETTAATADRCRQATTQADRAQADLAEAAETAGPITDRLVDATQRADRAGQDLSGRRDAARATLERQQMLRDQEQKLLAELEQVTGSAEQTLGALANGVSEAVQLNSRVVEQSQTSASLLERLGQQIGAADDRQQMLETSERTLKEFIEHAETIDRQVKSLQSKADAFEVHVGRLLERPEAIVGEAKQQSERLREVCQAVRKIFASLSQATLKANQKIEQFSQVNRSAESRAHRLSVETARAAETLRNWVAEAMRAQARLAESLERCPTLDQTHPKDGLRSLDSLARAFNDRGAELSAGPEVPAPPQNRTPVTPERSVQVRSRTEEINQLIEDAHEFVESGLEVAPAE